jgi:hypothetical protein
MLFGVLLKCIEKECGTRTGLVNKKIVPVIRNFSLNHKNHLLLECFIQIQIYLVVLGKNSGAFLN